MNLDTPKREQFASIFDGYLNQAKQPTWATLWYHPSRLEADVVRLVAVMDNPKTVKQLTREKDAIEIAMKKSTDTTGMRLFMEIIPTREFHLRYQTQTGYELIREWNGDRTDTQKANHWMTALKQGKMNKILVPVVVAGFLLMIIRMYTQNAM